MKNINILKDLKTLNKLHTSSVESHTTNNSIVDFTCDNAGYVDNVVIEGKTLVNLIRTNLSVEVWDNNRVAINLQDCNYLEGTYTLFNFSDKTIVLDIGEATTNKWLRTFALDTNKVKTFNINNGERIFNVNGLLASGWENNDKSKNEFRNSIVLLQGDHTDKPINYFEGLKSVGQGDKIGVLTYPTNNENLITSDVTLHEDYYISWGKGELVSWVDSSEKYYATDYIEVEPNTEYIFANINKNIAYYDANKTFIPMPLSEGYNEKNCTYFYNTSPSNAKYVRLSIKSIYIGKPYMAKGKYICDNKVISTTLRSLPNGVKDTIEKRGNKYVKVQRCEEIVLDGSLDEGWGLNQIENNTYQYTCSKNFTNAKGDDSLILTDREKCTQGSPSSLGIKFGSGNKQIYYRISSSTISSSTVEDFTAWLKANPLTVVYELATPIITELPNFNPQTYKGENVLIINSGVIQCDVSFDVCEGIRSELDAIKDKVSSLDDATTTINYRNLRNDITFLNGWGIWGNEARFNCYVADNVVKICILLAPSVLTQYTPIFKLPTQYITQKREYVTCIDNDKRCYLGGIDDSGIFTFENEISSESKYVAINFTYPLTKKVI